MTTTRELNVMLRELERENKMGADAYVAVMAELNARYEAEATENNARRVKMWWARFFDQDNARRTQPHYTEPTVPEPKRARRQFDWAAYVNDGNARRVQTH